ncbi:MAG: glutamate synthase, partial [Clostridiales bacterium]|nr:glutamate synthase [Clostridiales bacterium]
MIIDAKNTDARTLNEQVRQSEESEIVIQNCMGHRYIACGSAGKTFTVEGVAGNALGAYLNGSRVTVAGNAQDAVGDTMNDGSIAVRGNSGDATGYAMRGGKIFVRGNAGYRAGIHMKSYRDKVPALVIGGAAGDFLGEYQAGGIIAVLGVGVKGCVVGRQCGAGQHGGKIFLRAPLPADLPPQVKAEKANKSDLAELEPLIAEYCAHFAVNRADISGDFYVLTPN